MITVDDDLATGRTAADQRRAHGSRGPELLPHDRQLNPNADGGAIGTPDGLAPNGRVATALDSIARPATVGCLHVHSDGELYTSAIPIGAVLNYCSDLT